jgi:urease accessory protein
MKLDSKILLGLGGLLLLPSLASAHILPDGGVHDLRHGFAHPFTGLDHLLAMVAVGLWAAQQKGRMFWMLPLTFVSLMTAGGIIGAIGALLPSAELVIALSVLVLGALIATAVRLTPGVSIMLVGFFAVFHGYAHGREMPGSASVISFSVGFVIATLLLHAVGMAAGKYFQRSQRPAVIRFAGIVIALCSIWFLRD